MKKTPSTAIALGLGVGLCSLAASLAQAAERTPVVTTGRYAFYSDFDTNLNDALVQAGLMRKSRKPELFQSGDEASCFGKLPRSVRAAWDRSVDYYADIVSPGGWTGREQYFMRMQLAGIEEELKDAGARESVEIVRSFMGAAMPAYKACRWPAQDEKNKKWIADLKPLLDRDEQKIAARLEQLYQKRWRGLPMPVDVVETVNWSGANSVLKGPAGGHLLVSTDNKGLSALEVVFHEASHTLMDRSDPVWQALDKAASAVGFSLPRDLWHVVLFYTTGDTIRRILEDGGQPGYAPMLYGLFESGTWKEFRKPVETAWRPYLDGKRTLSEAAASLIEVIRGPSQPQRDPGRP